MDNNQNGISEVEVQKIAERYARRKQLPQDKLYDPLRPSVYLALQERQRAFIRCIKFAGLEPVKNRRVLEIGCGSGGNLIEFMQLGFRPENMVANELLEERAAVARHKLPAAIEVITGDASVLDLEENSFDIVLQSTVFTSILDEAFQHKLANKIWSLVKAGGGIMWYDFIFDNPRNPDVRGVPVSKIGALFPDARMKAWRVTLAPPVSRLVTKIHPGLYGVFSLCPWLRSHVLCWIQK